MLAVAARQWWVLVVQGLLGIVFGVLAILFPGIALITLAYLFAAWAIVSGLSHLGEGMRVAEMRGRSWPFAVSGVISIASGILAAVLPGVTVSTLILLLGAWLLVQGIMEVYTAWKIRDEVTGEWIIAAVGIIRAAIGLIVLAAPIVGAILTVTFLAAGAITTGIAAIAFGLRLRGLASAPGPARDPMAGSAA
jgi:uncharacterized membrane protein HdeD (DUF308 family)